MSAPIDVTSEVAAEAFEAWVDQLVKFGARVCEGMKPRASEEGWAPVLDAWQTFQNAMQEAQEGES